VSISTLVLARDEEANLPRCLESLRWCDDVVVVDDFSADSTAAIARRLGARVVQRHFDTFASQRNWALDEVPFRHPWVFHLDADEVVTPELETEMRAAVESSTIVAYRIPSRMMFMGRWLRHAATYPTYQVRLGRNPGLRFRQVGHGQKEDLEEGAIGTLNSAYLHFSFGKGLSDWFAKHNAYSSDEAQAAVASFDLRHPLGRFRLSALRGSARRRTLRELSYRLPFQPLLRFCYSYLFRGGFLDGHAGFTYCRLLALYEYLIVLKIREIRRRRRGQET